MKKSKSESPAGIEVTIDKLVYGGSGLGRHEGKVVFVPFSVPGDRLLVDITDQKKNFCWAAIKEILTPGPGRAQPQCDHFRRCGGCQWQHLGYGRQVETKRKILEEIFHHRFPETHSLPILMQPSPQEYGYRSRARVQLQGSGSQARLGFFASQSRRIVDVQECPLFRPSLNAALSHAREDCRCGRIPAGVLQLELACSEDERKWARAEGEESVDEDFSAAGKSQAYGIEEDLLHRTVGKFDYALSPGVFFQANDFMNSELVSTVRELAECAPTGSALDLYCGVGMFTLPLATRFNQVVAIENSQRACRLCASNASANGLDNVQVTCCDAATWIRAIGSVAPPGFDLVVLNPPRAGAGREIMGMLTAWAPEAFVYVSCDPQTLSRDVACLPARDYRIDFIKGFDLFPQTYHFETVLRLRRR